MWITALAHLFEDRYTVFMLTDVEYLKNILKGIVQYPDEMDVVRSVDEMGVLLTVSLAQPDMGRVIGKKGETAKAIRTVMNSFGFNVHEKLSIKILEPNQ